jgi:hypothetical protein
VGITGAFALCREESSAPLGDDMTLQPNLPIADHVPTYRMTAIQALAKFRKEWEEIADGESLLEVAVPVGLLLADVSDRLELSPQERFVFLGKILIKEIEEFMNQRIRPVEQ